MKASQFMLGEGFCLLTFFSFSENCSKCIFMHSEQAL